MSRPRLLLLLPGATYRAAAFVDAAGRLAADLTIATDHVSTFAAEQPANYLALDFADPARAAEQASAFAARYPVAGVFAVDDDTVVLAAHIARSLGLPYITPDAALAARDKHIQRTRLAAAGVQVPAFALHRFDEDLDAVAAAAGTPYPCVLKPLRLSASRGVIRADDPAQFVSAARRIARILHRADVPCEANDRFLVEAFVPGGEVALEGVVDGGRLTVLALFDKPDPLDGPFFEETVYVTPSRLSAEVQEEVRRCVAAGVKALDIARGPVHAEVRVNERGAWLIELAARPIGGRCSAVLRFGVDGEPFSLETLHLHRALGLPLAGFAAVPGAAAVMMIPTPRAGALVGVAGLERAGAVPLVEDIAITAHPGQELVPPPEGARYLGFIFARGQGPAEVEAAVREAHARLEIQLA